MAQTKVTDDVREVTEVDAAKITTGTIPEARIPDLAASKITSGELANARVADLPASKITSGTVDVARLPSTVLNSNVPATDTSVLEYNVAMLAFKIASESQVTKFQMVDQVIDEYQDATGVDASASTNELAGGSGTAKYYEGASGGTGPTGGSSTGTYSHGGVTYSFNKFTADANLVFTAGGTADVFLIGGGGASVSDNAGGGGAGGLIWKAGHTFAGSTTYAIDIGDGGTGTTGGSQAAATQGKDTTLATTTFVAKGGGYGGSGGTDAANGGSGGGSGRVWNGGSASGYGNQTGTYTKGDRTSTITITHSGTGNPGFEASEPPDSTYVNGTKTTSGSTGWYFGGSGAAADIWVKFEFDSVQTLVGARMFKDNDASQAYGTFKWQGSNVVGGASGYVDIGSSFVFTYRGKFDLESGWFGGGTSMSGNTTAYKYYRLIGVSGNLSGNHTHTEIEFKARTAGDSATYGFGFGGGAGWDVMIGPGGGGGGTAGIGLDGLVGTVGNGGAGKTDFVNSSATETTAFLLGTTAGTDSSNVATVGGSTGTLYIGGGGSGGTQDRGTNSGGGVGGLGGGGNIGAAALANTGSGGAGNLSDSGTGYSGGSGLAIIRYLPSDFITLGADLILQSEATAASGSAPTTANLVVLIEDSGSGTADLAADIKAKVSRASTADFTEYVTFTDEGNWGTDKRILRSNDIDLTGVDTGTSMRYIIATFNQSAGSKETRIHATSLAWA